MFFFWLARTFEPKPAHTMQPTEPASTSHRAGFGAGKQIDNLITTLAQVQMKMCCIPAIIYGTGVSAYPRSVSRRIVCSLPAAGISVAGCCSLLVPQVQRDPARCTVSEAHDMTAAVIWINSWCPGIHPHQHRDSS